MATQPVGQDSEVTRHSFVVRAWREAGCTGWRAWVQHTRSGEFTVAHDLNEVLAFVERRTGQWNGAVPKTLK